MKEWLTKCKEWWGTLAPREKQAVALGGAVLSIFIVYAGIWSPYVNHVHDLRERILSQQKLLMWMKTADVEMRRAEKEAQHSQQTISPVVLLSVLQKQINQAGLQRFLTQLKQTSNNTIEMHFQKVEFDKFSKLLIQVLKTQRVLVAQLSATAGTSPGVVNADVSLKLV